MGCRLTRHVQALALGAVLCLTGTVRGVVVHRSFKNGYPYEWNVSKEEATDSFRIGPRGTSYSNGRGHVVGASNAAVLAGVVVRVERGDEIVLQDARGGLHRVRLFGIAAPKKGEPYAAEATARLMALVKGQPIEVECVMRDRAGVVTGILYQGEDNVNVQLVEEGCARAYHYGNNPRYLGAQNKAKAAKRGLWGEGASRSRK